MFFVCIKIASLVMVISAVNDVHVSVNAAENYTEWLSGEGHRG